MTARFTIPGRLPGLNEYIAAERQHRQKAAAMKKQCEHMIALLIKSQLRGVRFTGPVRMKYTWHEKDRRRDLDNIAFAKKFIQDALVAAGTIPNDNQAWVQGFTDEFRVDKLAPRIEVEISEVKADGPKQ